MRSGKSAAALDLYAELSARGVRCALLVAGTKKRWELYSRSGASAPAMHITRLTEDDTAQTGLKQCFIVDEAQFVTLDQLRNLIALLHQTRSYAIFFGLYWSAEGAPFEYVKELQARGVPMIRKPHGLACWCGQPAAANRRVPLFGGARRVGYVAVCERHIRVDNNASDPNDS